MIAAALALAAVGVHTVHPFLAIDQRVPADTLVVEGWMPEYAIRQCVPLLRTNAYVAVFTVGGPVTDAESPAADDDTRAYAAAVVLRKAGVDPKTITMVPTNTVPRDRTFTCALELKQWLVARHITPRGINVVTLGPHARRSRLLFQKAFGPVIPIGVIAMKNREYDADHWWRYSEGVKEVISESAAYLYARLLFRPYGA